jgi:hypothetical protein
LTLNFLGGENMLLGELCKEGSTPSTFGAMFWVFENQGNSQEEK